VHIDIGFKGGVNAGYLQVEPYFDHAWAEREFEGDDAFGVGGHGGLFAQVRFLDRVGLEVDVLYSRDELWRTDQFDLGAGYHADIEHTDWANNLRIPVLLKVFHVFGPASISLGGGLEYVTPLDHGHDIIEAESSNVPVPQQVLDDGRKLHESAPADMLFLLGQLEVTIELGPVSIPIDLRAGRNLSQSDQFEDRYDYEYEQQGRVIKFTGVDVQPIYSWDFRILTGLAVCL